jgi:hypothetical protein
VKHLFVIPSFLILKIFTLFAQPTCDSYCPLYVGDTLVYSCRHTADTATYHSTPPDTTIQNALITDIDSYYARNDTSVYIQRDSFYTHEVGFDTFLVTNNTVLISRWKLIIPLFPPGPCGGMYCNLGTETLPFQPQGLSSNKIDSCWDVTLSIQGPGSYVIFAKGIGEIWEGWYGAGQSGSYYLSKVVSKCNLNSSARNKRLSYSTYNPICQSKYFDVQGKLISKQSVKGISGIVIAVVNGKSKIICNNNH